MSIAEFRSRLDAARQQISGIRWYPYDSLANLQHLDRLLEGGGLDLAGLAGGKRVLDIGCADGDISFWLASQGFDVHAVDHPRTNHNAMAGVQALRRELGLNLEISSIDLDAQFPIEGHYGLAIFLGILYHLKNPFYVLETLARHVQHIVLSTRVMQRAPQLDGLLGKAPLAYLVGEEELNDDNSNYWIFTPPGLERLLDRTRWRVLKTLRLGDTSKSNPVDADHDERMFCLCESRFGMKHLKLLHGWYEPETEGWRWTAPQFSVSAQTASAAPALRMVVYAPDALLARGPLRLAIRANGLPLAAEEVRLPGELRIDRRLPVHGAVTLDFELDRAYNDGRQLGIIVASCEVA